MMLLAAIATSAFLTAFGGTWSCAQQSAGVARARSTTWTIEAAPHSTWTRVTFVSARDGGGVGYVGYLPLGKTWIYEDFHDDGSFSTNASPGPVNGTWTWSGEYTTPARVVHYAVQWRRDGDRIGRAFGRLIGASFRESSSDLCRRRAATPASR